MSPRGPRQTPPRVIPRRTRSGTQPRMDQVTAKPQLFSLTATRTKAMCYPQMSRKTPRCSRMSRKTPRCPPRLRHLRIPAPPRPPLHPPRSTPKRRARAQRIWIPVRWTRCRRQRPGPRCSSRWLQVRRWRLCPRSNMTCTSLRVTWSYCTLKSSSTRDRRPLFKLI